MHNILTENYCAVNHNVKNFNKPLLNKPPISLSYGSFPAKIRFYTERKRQQDRLPGKQGSEREQRAAQRRVVLRQVLVERRRAAHQIHAAPQQALARSQHGKQAAQRIYKGFFRCTSHLLDAPQFVLQGDARAVERKMLVAEVGRHRELQNAAAQVDLQLSERLVVEIFNHELGAAALAERKHVRAVRAVDIVLRGTLHPIERQKGVRHGLHIVQRTGKQHVMLPAVSCRALVRRCCA